MALSIASSSLASSFSTLNTLCYWRWFGKLSSTASNNRSDNSASSLLDGTKKASNQEDVLKNQAESESEKRSVFGAVPSSGPPARDREETRDWRPVIRQLDVFRWSRPRVNQRKTGIVWAFAVERMTGQTVTQQLYGPGNFGLFPVALLFAYASLVPMFKGESPDRQSLGPFQAMAERWNGRTAMLGFLALVVKFFSSK